MNISIHMSDEAQSTVREAILGPLVAYNTRKTGINDYRPLVLTLQDESGLVIGGLWGRTAYAWLFVELLFVPDKLRGHGIGAELLSRAESELLGVLRRPGSIVVVWRQRFAKSAGEYLAELVLADHEGRPVIERVMVI